MRRYTYRVVRDVSDGSWTVERRYRHGFSVVYRGDEAGAHRYAQMAVEAMRAGA